MEFIDLNAQLRHMRSAIDSRIQKVLDHGLFILGPEVHELEEKLADYVGVKHCVTCANGTDALQIALMSLNIGQGDIVFTTSFSFFSTAEVISLVGATPYFVDIEKETFNICPVSLKNAILDVKKRNLGVAKAVIAVDLFGLPANYSTLEPLCERENVLLIEDAAQGFGGAIGSRLAGSFGDIATTSFFPAKPLGCFGDGGAIFTNDSELAELANSIRVHGKGEHKYENIRIGLNSRLDTIQAAVLLEKLEHFPQELKWRQRISECYQSILPPLTIPSVPNNFSSSWAQYTVVSPQPQRDILREKLQAYDIPTGVYYPKPLNEQIAFKGKCEGITPMASEMANTVFSLPMSGYVELDDAKRVVEILNLINSEQTRK